jgi:hypothetical protein
MRAAFSARGARTSAATTAAPPVEASARRVGLRERGACAGLRKLGLRIARRLRAHLIAHGDEERRDVLAVAIDLGERGAGAARGEAGRGELQLHSVRVRVGAAHGALGGGFLDDDLGHRLTAHVVVSAEEGAGAEQAAKRAVVQRGDGFLEGGQAVPFAVCTYAGPGPAAKGGARQRIVPGLR